MGCVLDVKPAAAKAGGTVVEGRGKEGNSVALLEEEQRVVMWGGGVDVREEALCKGEVGGEVGRVETKQIVEAVFSG